MSLYRLQHSPAEWQRRERTGVCRDLVVSLLGDVAVKDRRINKQSSHTLSPWAVPSSLPGALPASHHLSTPRLPDSQKTPVLGQSCNQLQCNRSHHQHSASCDMATTLLGLVPGTHMGPALGHPGTTQCGAAFAHGFGELPAPCKTMVGCYLVCPVEC